MQYRGLWCSGKGYHYRCRDTTDSEGFFYIRRDRIDLSEEGDCRITAVTPTAKGHEHHHYANGAALALVSGARASELVSAHNVHYGRTLCG